MLGTPPAATNAVQAATSNLIGWTSPRFTVIYRAGNVTQKLTIPRGPAPVRVRLFSTS